MLLVKTKDGRLHDSIGTVTCSDELQKRNTLRCPVLALPAICFKVSAVVHGQTVIKDAMVLRVLHVWFSSGPALPAAIQCSIALQFGDAAAEAAAAGLVGELLPDSIVC